VSLYRPRGPLDVMVLSMSWLRAVVPLHAAFAVRTETPFG